MWWGLPCQTRTSETMRKTKAAMRKMKPPRPLPVIALMSWKANVPRRMASWSASPCAAWKRVRVSWRGTTSSAMMAKTSPTKKGA